jgi:hypothetical protein
VLHHHILATIQDGKALERKVGGKEMGKLTESEVGCLFGGGGGGGISQNSLGRDIWRERDGKEKGREGGMAQL